MTHHMFVAALGAEVNTFSPLPIDMARFEELWLYKAGNLHVDMAVPLIAAPLRRAWEHQAEGKLKVSQGLCAGAQPGGMIARQTYELLRDALLDDLRQSSDVDIVVLGLHGATVADGYDDCEGDLLSAVREVIGKHAVIAALLDPHCHISTTMLNTADLMFAYKEYPHDDIFDIADRLVDAAVATADGLLSPIMRAWDCRTIGIFNTYHEPMRGIVDALNAETAADERVIDISIAHGFPWGDVADMGTKVWVTTDDDPVLAAEVAQKYGLEIESIRKATQPKLLSASDAIALAWLDAEAPLIIAETADNPGGGAPGDATHLLGMLLDAGIERVAACIFWDPVAVDLCFAAGTGATMPLRIGGGVSRSSGDPLDLNVEVVGLIENLEQPFGGGTWQSGRAACVIGQGATIVLSVNRTQCFATEAFSSFGIDLSSMRAIVVKSSNHFESSFRKLSNRIVTVATAGALNPDPCMLPYAKVARPIWPLDRDAKGSAVPSC